MLIYLDNLIQYFDINVPHLCLPLHVGVGLVQVPSSLQVVFLDPSRLYPGKQANVIVFEYSYTSPSFEPCCGIRIGLHCTAVITNVQTKLAFKPKNNGS